MKEEALRPRYVLEEEFLYGYWVLPASNSPVFLTVGKVATLFPVDIQMGNVLGVGFGVQNRRLPFSLGQIFCLLLGIWSGDGTGSVVGFC